MLGCLSALLSTHQPRHGHEGVGVLAVCSFHCGTAVSQGQERCWGVISHLGATPVKWDLGHPAVSVAGTGIILFPGNLPSALGIPWDQVDPQSPGSSSCSTETRQIKQEV